MTSETAHRDPVRELVALLNADPALGLCAEYVSESPAWSQAFIRYAERCGDPDRVVVATHDGADWALTLWQSTAAFYHHETLPPDDFRDFADTAADPRRALSAVRELLR